MVPALIGAFVGAPVLAREMETGTFRYAWTQGFGRWRWTLAKLVGLAVAVTAAAGAISVLFSWYYQPYFGADNQARGLSPAVFACSRPVRPARGRVRRLDAGRLRHRRPGRHAHPPGRPRDRRHPGRVRRARHRDRGVAAPALLRADGDQVTERAGFRVGRRASTGRPKAASAVSQSVLYQVLQGAPAQVAGKEGGGPNLHALAAWQYLVQHGYTQVTTLPAGQPVLGVPVDRGGWLLGVVGAAHRHHPLAGPSPSDLKTGRIGKLPCDVCR